MISLFLFQGAAPGEGEETIWYAWRVRSFLPEIGGPMARFIYFPALLLLILLFLGGPDAVPFRSFKELWNLGHVPAFALWNVLILRWARGERWPWRRQASAVFAFSLLFGLLSEGGQVWFARSPDLADLARDLLGGGVALAFFAPARDFLPAPRKHLLQGAVLSLLAVSLIPFALALADDVGSRTGFPVLSDFESPLETGRWDAVKSEISRARGVAVRGEGTLRVDLSTDDYSGAALRYFPGDWRGFRTLRFELLNPSADPLPVRFRIHDRHHERSGWAYRDRFNTARTLRPGWNSVVIPLAEVAKAPADRGMDMAHIARVGVFVQELPRPRTVYIDYLRLE